VFVFKEKYAQLFVSSKENDLHGGNKNGNGT